MACTRSANVLFLPLLHCSLAVLGDSVLCWDLLLSIEVGST